MFEIAGKPCHDTAEEILYAMLYCKLETFLREGNPGTQPQAIALPDL